MVESKEYFKRKLMLFRYYGAVENDDANGLGFISHPNGKNDLGFYKDGTIDGLGRLFFPEGNFYDGELKDGQLEGEGMIF